jgi:hypothetical protein
MSDQTFEQLWKGLMLYAPELPTPLAKQFINNAYSRALSANRWFGLRGLDEFEIPTPYTTGTVTVNNGSTAVVGSGTTFTSAMVGRQFIVDSQLPFYTIITFTDATNIVLDRPFSGTSISGSSDWAIEYVYLEVPSDFLSFTSVIDPENEWRLWTGVSQEKLNWRDPARDVKGTSWVLSPINLSANGYPRYELWPRSSASAQLPFVYTKKPALLSSNSDTAIFPIRGDVIREGALADLALWPGTSKQKNPYHDMNQHRIHEKRFREFVGMCEVEDQEIDPSWIQYPGFTDYPWAPVDAKFLQQHDVI